MPAEDSARLRALLKDGVPYRVALALSNTPTFDVETGKIFDKYLPGGGGGGSGTGLPATMRSRSSAYTAVAGDFVLANASSAFTVTLPTSPAVGALVTVRKVDPSDNPVTVAPAGGGSIDGDANATIVTQYFGAVFEHVGSNAWHIVSLASAGVPAAASGGLDDEQVIGLTTYNIKSRNSDYSALHLDYVCFDISTGSAQLLLPNAPLDKTRVGAKIIGISGANTLTVVANGVDTIDVPGGPETMVLNLMGQAVELQYDQPRDCWVTLSSYTPYAPALSTITVVGSAAQPVDVTSYARPSNAAICYWVCAAGITPTFAAAGDIIFNLSA